MSAHRQSLIRRALIDGLQEITKANGYNYDLRRVYYEPRAANESRETPYAVVGFSRSAPVDNLPGGVKHTTTTYEVMGYVRSQSAPEEDISLLMEDIEARCERLERTIGHGVYQILVQDGQYAGDQESGEYACLLTVEVKHESSRAA